ncbi:MAG: formate dehydrogenase accessory sulfurtransferase FdhD [Candidatus Thorarchaeota archaeon]
MKTTRVVEVDKMNEGRLVRVTEVVAVEKRVRVQWADGCTILESTFTPSHAIELALGLLVVRGYPLVSPDAIFVTETRNEVRVVIDDSSATEQEEPSELEPQPVTSRHIAESIRMLRERQVILRTTGGAHGALIRGLESDRHFFAEDIRRANALLKAIGGAKREHIDLTRSALYFTGRLTSEVIDTCDRAGIPMVASLAVATDLGISTARDGGITVLGSAGDGSPWVYNVGRVLLVM